MDDSSSQLYFNTSKSMAEALAANSNRSSSNRNREMENLSHEISKYPRDLTHRLVSTNNQSTRRLDGLNTEGDLDEDEDGLNLGLGLSLGGKFGVDKSHKGLIRSSSIAGTMPLIREVDQVAPPPPAPVHTLVRTASLPVESEEQWRKRKEIQTLRRMEAKRRRSEKQRSMKESGVEEKGGLNLRGRLKREEQCLGMSSNKVVGGSSSSGGANVEVKGRRSRFGSLQGFLTAQSNAEAQGSQGSGESQGGNSSGASEMESKTHQGWSSGGEARSPRSNEESESSQGEKKREEEGMEDMPCVFTIGSGPNGVRKVEGILYRYGKGEGVRIMCVCHASFFSPAEFVKHAGGTDVDHPLRHIVVSPSATATPFP